MKKIILYIILLNTFIYANAKNDWTILLYQTFSIEEAKEYAQNIPNNNVNISIIKNRNSYMITYGVFNSYLETKSFLNKNRNKIKSKNPIIYKNKFSLSKINIDSKIDNQNNNNSHNPNIKKIETKINKDTQNKNINNDDSYNRKSTMMNKYKFKTLLEYSPIVLSGDLKLGLNNSKVDLESDLGIKDAEHTIIPTISIIRDKHNVFMSYVSNNYKSSNTISKYITLDNYTYATNTNINTTIDNSWIDVGYRYNYLFADIGFDIHSYVSDIKIDSSTNTTNINGSYIFYSLGLDMTHEISKYIVFYGGSLGTGREVNYLDFYLSFGKNLNIIKNSNISIGYKIKQLNIQDDIYKSTISYSGIFFNFTKTF